MPAHHGNFDVLFIIMSWKSRCLWNVTEMRATEKNLRKMLLPGANRDVSGDVLFKINAKRKGRRRGGRR